MDYEGNAKLKLVSQKSLLAGYLAILVSLAACSSDEAPEYVERPVQELYNQALAALNNEEYLQAARGFDEVERQHPYSVWSTKAQLMSSFAYYQSNQYDQAILAAERFVELHPGNKDVAYAYYLVAISYYEQITGVERDQKVTRQALAALQNLVRRFPNTEYARRCSFENRFDQRPLSRERNGNRSILPITGLSDWRH